MEILSFFNLKSIKTKLLIEISLLIALISIFIFIYFPASLRSQAFNAEVDKLKSISEIVSFSVGPALFFNDIEAIKEALLGARRNKDLIYILVCDNSGRVIHAFNEGKADKTIFIQSRQNPHLSQDRMILNNMKPILHKNQEIGKLYLGLSLEELREKIGSIRKTIALVSLAVFIISISFVFGISTLITSSLGSLTDTVEQIAKGNLTKRSHISSQDEVGQLSKSFNTMVDILERTRKELEDLNLSLEKRVSERTKDLQNEIIERRMIEKELLKAKERAEAANLAKSEFLANMSHELRTPLNAIIGFTEMLDAEYFGILSKKQAEYIKDILESGRHLLVLINDILDLSKIEAGKMELELSRIQINELLEHSLIMIKEKCLKHNIRLNLQISEDMDGLEILADQRKLKQIMFNLLSNAAKFSPDGGEISVNARQEGKNLIISVTDTGIGIDSTHQKRIFEEFYQVLRGPTDKTPGTGLGLALAKRLVEMQGGRISVESEGEGKGSRFSFELPIRRRVHRRKMKINIEQKEREKATPRAKARGFGPLA